jgi:hypothetical protein
MKRSIHLSVLILVLAVSTWAPPVQAATTVQVYFQPGDVFVAPQTDFAIDLRANITADPPETLDPVIQWDIWLDFDHNALTLTNSAVGSDWSGIDPNPTDTHLFGFSIPGVFGEDVLLATLDFQFQGDGPNSIGIDAGASSFTGISGFPLVGEFSEASVYPVPLPGSVMLLSFGLMGLVLYRRRSR